MNPDKWSDGKINKWLYLEIQYRIDNQTQGSDPDANYQMLENLSSWWFNLMILNPSSIWLNSKTNLEALQPMIHHLDIIQIERQKIFKYGLNQRHAGDASPLKLEVGRARDATELIWALRSLRGSFNTKFGNWLYMGCIQGWK